MFGWLVSLWHWWKRGDRKLFQFFDGRRYVRIDPWPAYRQLYNDDEFVPSQMMQAVQELEEPELSKCVRCCRRAFGMEAFDPQTGRGLTVQETLAVLGDFMEWIEELAKKNGGLPILSLPTASTASDSPECPPQATQTPLPCIYSPEESTPAGVS